MAQRDRVIVWMRRALRVQDNYPLREALRTGAEVIPVVFLRDDPEYKQDTPRRMYIRGALTRLHEELTHLGSRLVCVTGDPVDVLPEFAQAISADNVYAAAVYDHETAARDRQIAAELARRGIGWSSFKDRVLREHTEILKSDGTPYTVFTPYRNAWRADIGLVPRPFPAIRSLPPVVLPDSYGRGPEFESFDADAGERSALRRLRVFLKEKAQRYRVARDLPAVDGTSRLSADLAHGTISIRRVFHEARAAFSVARGSARESIGTFVDELVWREFYYQIAAAFPHVTSRAFRPSMNAIRWTGSRDHFTAWCEGRTGYPIVDAGMRQLRREGWMHNRVRMIVASFLTKDLHCNWQWGEHHFLEHLIDADIPSNNGGWQWTAGTGTDASPWFRIFNPVLQGLKFDPDGDYIRKYIPALRQVPPPAIHQPWILSENERASYGVHFGGNYHPPIVDHVKERGVAMDLYREAAGDRSQMGLRGQTVVNPDHQSFSRQ